MPRRPIISEFIKDSPSPRPRAGARGFPFFPSHQAARRPARKTITCKALTSTAARFIIGTAITKG